MTRGLEGIKIVEIAQHLAAPAATGILADFGAQVIHVEHPVHGDGNRGYFAMTKGRSPVGPFNYVWEMINRNKRGMAVDIRSEDGQRIIHRLVAQSDVFMSNLRPYELEKYHFTYDCLSKVNPRLVCANLNGLGQRGPERDAPGYDGPSYWARGGAPAMMSQSVREPPGSPPGFGDNNVAQCFAGAIALALLVRERTGIGQEVDVSLFNSGIYAQAMDTQAALTTGRNPTESRRTCDPETPIDWHRVAGSPTPRMMRQLAMASPLNLPAFQHVQENGFASTLGDIVPTLTGERD